MSKTKLNGATTNSNGFNKFPKKVGIIHSDVKRRYFPTYEQYLTEKDAVADAKAVAGYLKKLDIKTTLFAGNVKLPEKLKKSKPQMVINLIGSVRGNEFLAATIPALMELLEIPYTGAGILGESLSYNKFLTKKLLEQNGIPVPQFQLFNTQNDPLNPTIRFPLISKLNEIHGAVEITNDSVSETEGHLRARLKFLIKTYEQPALVEEFIVGREVSAILLEGGNRKIYMAEKVFSDKKSKYLFASFENTWLAKEDNVFHFQIYKDNILKEYVRKAFDITDMADYGKFDIRIDSSGRYYFLDCNSNTMFGPPETECPLSNILNLYNVPFIDILKRLVMNTMKMYKS